ncbi:MFS transporter [Marinithermofilum abyssi]|uniref:Putative proline/betaine transporter n=1 Tax=Marinithermofilum abyssi TaxID=1571185 RepID=A0A8J2VH32_9BACL|nr:MFS transporter [Marinithermofilum abyssi]GGE11546.1 MFS transporter [Marinithermofilum abyssi]
MNTTETPTSPSPSPHPGEKLPVRALIASLAGTAIEWYDFFLYGIAAALVFSKIFFPTGMDPFIALLLSYATFGIPFFIRPLGGLVFSHIGDRIGRKKTLIYTLMLMGIATVLIGLLPGYETIGIAAPILLTLLRVVQGIGIGGEWGGAVLLAVEYSSNRRRGFFGSVPQMGVPLGLLLGTLAMTLVSLMPEKLFLSWGWRIPFILSFVLVVVGLWIRKGIDETPAFQKNLKQGNISRVPLLDTFRHHWKSVLLSTGMKVVETAPFYIFSTYIISYATAEQGYSNSIVLNAITLATFVSCLMIPLMGILSDRIGRKPVYIGGTVGIILVAFPYFYLVETKSTLLFTLGSVLALGIIWSAVTGVLGTLYSEVFSTRVRYTGVTLGYQLGAALAGGTAPMIAAALVRQAGGVWTPLAFYLIITGAISLLSIWVIKETRGSELT